MNFNSTTNSSYFNQLPINTGVDGMYYCYLEILQKLYNLMQYMTYRHSKTLFIRFDVRFPEHYATDGGNSEISHLFKDLREKAQYDSIELVFLWVREQSWEKHQHYHCIVMIDGSKVQYYQRFIFQVIKAWSRVLRCDASGLIFWCNQDYQGMPVENGIMIARPRRNAQGVELESQQSQFQTNLNRCFEWGSYLAKTNQKDNTPPGVRRYGASQIR
ncbi:MAG: inovirus-type Gp2 protein [Desulfovibrionaceae bacterium]